MLIIDIPTVIAIYRNMDSSNNRDNASNKRINGLVTLASISDVGVNSLIEINIM
jgi:hypothetical protein